MAVGGRFSTRMVFVFFVSDAPCFGRATNIINENNLCLVYSLSKFLCLTKNVTISTFYQA